MRQRNNIAEASAEMLLNYLYPEVERKWIAHGEGSFYRNYTNDLLDFDDETMDAWLARDTFLRLLPDANAYTTKAAATIRIGRPVTLRQHSASTRIPIMPRITSV